MVEYLVRMPPKQQGKMVLCVILTIIFSLIIFLTVIRTPAYIVYGDGHKLFYIKHTQDFDIAMEQLQAEQTAQFNQTLLYDERIELKRVFVPRSLVLSAENVALAINDALYFRMIATGIVVNGEHIVYVENEDAANSIIEKIIDQYAKVEEGETLLDVTLNEDVQLINEEVVASQLIPLQDAYNLITIGTTSPEEYTVVEGDSLWLIARRNDMYVDDIVRTNALTSDRLSLDQKLILVKTKPYINVATVVEGDRNEIIPYEVKVVTDNSISSSSVKITQEGKPGEKHVVYQAVKINGQVESREIKQETILKQAVDQIMVKGGSVQVASRGATSSSARGGSGNLSWPIYGSISQYFSGGHTGLDITNSVGTPISAADNGYITYTGWQGGYGNFVIIDHGNGIVTRYAHCQSIKVSVGQNVAKGDIIATVGSTGNSTGPHLHFEVLSGGSFVNPLNALP